MNNYEEKYKSFKNKIAIEIYNTHCDILDLLPHTFLNRAIRYKILLDKDLFLYVPNNKEDLSYYNLETNFNDSYEEALFLHQEVKICSIDSFLKQIRDYYYSLNRHRNNKLFSINSIVNNSENIIDFVKNYNLSSEKNKDLYNVSHKDKK